jgi:hypothetical protein
MTTREILQTPLQFCLLWAAYCLRHDGRAHDHQPARPLARNAGLGATAAAYALTVGAFGNAGGRVAFELALDSLGRLATLRTMVLISAIAMPVLLPCATRSRCSYLAVAVVYWCYGAAVRVRVYDRGLLRHAQPRRELRALFTAWGTAGVIGPLIAAVCSTRRRATSTRFMRPPFWRSARSARC